MAYIQQINSNNKKIMISKILAIAAMALVLIAIVDILVAQGRTGFLHMTDYERGRTLGLSSIALFFAAFGFGYKEKSNVITSLLIAGSSITVGFLLLAPTIGLLLGFALSDRNVYIGIIAISSITIGLGLFRVVRRQ